MSKSVRNDIHKQYVVRAEGEPGNDIHGCNGQKSEIWFPLLVAVNRIIMDGSAWIPDYIGHIILDRRLFWIVYFGSFILDRLSESDYNDTAISRPFIFDRVEERAIE